MYHKHVTCLACFLTLVWVAQASGGYPLKQASTAQPPLFFMVDSSDHVSGKTGLSPTVKISKAGAGGVTPSGAVSPVDATNHPTPR
jgi:hypothetical protein